MDSVNIEESKVNGTGTPGTLFAVALWIRGTDSVVILLLTEMRIPVIECFF